MKQLLVWISKITVLLMLVAMSHAEGTQREFRNVRRGGSNMGLFPFPRVGRSDSSITNPYADVHESKRQGLIPFPRVGRSEFSPQAHAALVFPPWLMVPNSAADLMEYQKRNNGPTNVNGGMWFGPRLGRLQKRSNDDSEMPWAYVALKEPILKPIDYSPRAGRENVEETEDSLLDEGLPRRLDSKISNNISQQ